jgi:hypothetical protein
MHIGFIGLGSQGCPIAERIIEAGYPTTRWAPQIARRIIEAGYPTTLWAPQTLLTRTVRRHFRESRRVTGRTRRR